MNMGDRKRTSNWERRSVVPLAMLGALGCDNTMDDDPYGSQVAGTMQIAVWWGTPSAEPALTAPGPTGSSTLGPSEMPAGPTGYASDPILVEGTDRRADAENAALRELIWRFKGHNGDVNVDPHNYEDKAELVGQLDALPSQPDASELQHLPDVVQLNAGETALAYSPCGGKTSQILAPLKPSLWAPHTWESPDWGIDTPTVTRHNHSLEDGAVWYGSVSRFGYEGTPSSTSDEIYPHKSLWIQQFLSCQIEDKRQAWVAPIAVHHLNHLYFNIDAMRKLLNVSDPQAVLEQMDLPKWLSFLEHWQTEFTEGVVMALPSDPSSGWALNLLAAENLKVVFSLAASLPADTDDPDVAHRVMEAMTTLRNVSQLLRPAPTSTGLRLTRLPIPPVNVWSVQKAMNAVESGEALFTVMGDWAYPDVRRSGKVGMLHFPGSKHVRVYTIDGFVALKKLPHPEDAGATAQARAWMLSTTDPDAARAFADAKGATTLEDWLDDSIRRCAKTASAADQDCWVIPALSLRGENCGGADAMLDWALDPDAENRARAEVSLRSIACRSHSSSTENP